MSDFCEMMEELRRHKPGVFEIVEFSGDAVSILPGGLRNASSAAGAVDFPQYHHLRAPHNIKCEGDSVHRQPHYAYGIEPIEYMESRFTKEEFRGWLLGNVIKYCSRFTRKDGVKDLLKAQDYLARLIAFEQRQETKL